MATSGDRTVLSADGPTTPRFYVGPVRVQLSGNFGGGTFKIEAEDPSGAPVPVVGTARTAADDFRVDFPDGVENKINGDLSGATTPALVVLIQGVDRGA